MNKEILAVIADQCVPSNWLNPLLTGPNKVIGEPHYNSQDIEILLNTVRERIKTWPINEINDPVNDFECKNCGFNDSPPELQCPMCNHTAED